MTVNGRRSSHILGVAFVLGGTLVAPAFAEVLTSFDGVALDPNVQFDTPNTDHATITFDGANGELDFFATGNVNMWDTRQSVPFAWTSKPTASYGQTWRAETQVRYNTPMSDGGLRIAGITFYPGPDGTGGANDGIEFTFALDQWDAPYGVWVQGLGDNQPGNSADNLFAALATDSVFLRTEVTELGAWDTYSFFYKLAAADAWTQLGSLQASFDDSRVALFLKGYPGTDPSYMNASFTYFNVGLSASVPEIDPTGMGSVLALVTGALGLLERRRLKVA